MRKNGAETDSLVFRKKPDLLLSGGMSDAEKIFVVKTLRLIDGEDAEHIEAMKEEVRQKRQEKRHREGVHEG